MERRAAIPARARGLARALAATCLVAMLLAPAGCGGDDGDAGGPAAGEARLFPVPATEATPSEYVCYRAAEAPAIDGRLDDPAWKDVPWTADFGDIRGPAYPAPALRTRARMLWDDSALYVGVELEEPHVWGTLVERDAVIYHDDDVELFIDPDGDTHDYCELEVNALGTVWDLLLRLPYRDTVAGGAAVDSWNVEGLRVAVHVDGTLNDPSDTDRGWSVELALPWAGLAPCARRAAPPEPGERWWINLSRVDWSCDVVDGAYVKRTDPATGKPLGPENQVWSPQGLVDMHYPEMWGRVQFSDRPAGEPWEPFVADPTDPARRALRRLYYAQREWQMRHGAWCDDPALLQLDPPAAAGFEWPPRMTASADGWEAATTDARGNVLTIRHDGRLRIEPRAAR